MSPPSCSSPSNTTAGSFRRTHASGTCRSCCAYARVGLDWLLKMHPSPHEFYYQVGDETDHDTWRLPEDGLRRAQQTWKPRPVYFGVGANLAGRTAVALSIASRLYRPYAPQFAARCLAAAQTVYRLGLENRKVVTTRPLRLLSRTHLERRHGVGRHRPLQVHPDARNIFRMRWRSRWKPAPPTIRPASTTPTPWRTTRSIPMRLRHTVSCCWSTCVRMRN